MPYIGASPNTAIDQKDLNGQKLILDADADTSITADTDDTIHIEIAGADDFTFTANTFTVLSGSTLAIASGATIANSGTATGFSNPASANGAALGSASLEWSDLYLAESGVIYFGADQDVTVTHDPDDGLFLKSIATADNNPVLLTLQTGETDMAADDIIGAIQFQAPDEGTGTDAVLVSGAIKAYAEGNHSSSSNATSLGFYTGASEVATEKMTITSAGKVGIGGTSNAIDEIFHIETTVNDAILKMESTGGQAMIDIVGNRTGDADIGHLRFRNAETATLAQVRVERSGANNSGLLKIQTNNAGTLGVGMQIDNVGHVTKPLSCSFSVIAGANQNNVTGDDTRYTVQYTAAEWDVNSDFDLTNNKFVCPVTGTYHFTAGIALGGIASDQTIIDAFFHDETDNWYQHNLDVGNVGNVSGNYYLMISATIKKAAGTDVIVQVEVHNGSKVVDVLGAAYPFTWFSGFLVG